MTDEKNLKPGSFYWVKPVFDVDFVPSGFDGLLSEGEFEASWNHWWNSEQPALYLGDDHWVFIGQDKDDGRPWPVNWVGGEIIKPE